MITKQLNREATIQNIVDKAGDNIKSIEHLKTKDDEFLIDSTILWKAKAIYD